MENFLPLSRDVQSHWIYKDSQYFHAWCHMLFAARYAEEPKTDIYDGILYTVSYGEFIFGYASWSRRLGIGQQRLRTFIRKLIGANMIVCQKKHSKFTVYRITNFKKFNSLANIEANRQQEQQPSGRDGSANIAANRQSDKQPTGSQQAANRQLTTKEERRKKDKKDLYIEQIKTYTDVEMLQKTIMDFAQFRADFKKPLTPHALGLLLKKLSKLSGCADKQAEILNQSILNGWLGVFPLREDNKPPAGSKSAGKENMSNFEQRQHEDAYYRDFFNNG